MSRTREERERVDRVNLRTKVVYLGRSLEAHCGRVVFGQRKTFCFHLPVRIEFLFRILNVDLDFGKLRWSS